MNTGEIVQIFRAINNKISCPLCGARYSFEHIKIIKIEGETCFIGLTCGQHPPVIISVVLRQRLQYPDQKEERVVNSDDLITSYQKLKRIKSVIDLFRKDTRR